MKKNNLCVAIPSSPLAYESPRVHMIQVELEHSIAAASVNSTITESWQTENQQQDQEWL